MNCWQATGCTPDEIATRLRIAGARAIFTQDVILRGGRALPLYERVVEADAPQAIVLPAADRFALALRDGDVAWDAFLGEEGPFASVPGGPSAPGVDIASETPAASRGACRHALYLADSLDG